MRSGRLELVGIVVLGFLSGASGVLVLPGRDVPFPPTVPVVALAVGLGAVCAAAFAALLLVLRRNRGTERAEVRRAIDDGVLPEGVQRTRLRNALESRADAMWTQRWLLPVMTLFQLLTGVPRVLDAGATPYSRVFWSAALVFWVCAGIGLPLRARRERPILRRLLEELDRPRAADSTRID